MEDDEATCGVERFVPCGRGCGRGFGFIRLWVRGSGYGYLKYGYGFGRGCGCGCGEVMEVIHCKKARTAACRGCLGGTVEGG